MRQRRRLANLLTGIAILGGGGVFAPAPVRALAAQESILSVPVVDVGRNAPEAGAIVDLQPLTGSIVVDGLVDESAWAAIRPLSLTMYEPTYRGESGRRIELRATYDHQALYLSARFHHDDPGNIRAFSLTRDRWAGDDSFGVLLDTFNDNENAVRFVGMPLGNRMDMSVSGGGVEERGSGGPRGTSWNTFWDYETAMLPDGWSGEMRIPFSSLRFEAGADGATVMGMMVYAYEPATGSRWTYPAIPRSASYSQVSAWQDVRIRDVVPETPTYVTPYALTGAARSAVLPEGAASWGTERDDNVEVGLDVKFNPTPNLTLDLSVNTDFAAVEADQQQVNLTRFSLFFDEKRPFFQERAGIFSFGTGAERGTLFYSRRIGLHGGAPVPILGGARLVGRVGAWDLGLIDMQTERVGDASGENFGVLRLRRQLLNENSFVGGMTTSRIDGDGVYNVTWGLDALLRPFGDEFVTLKVLQTVQGGDDGRDAVPDGIDAGRLMAEWTRRRVEGLSYTNVFVWSGAGYDPGIGFEARTDFKRAQSDWNYQWYPTEAGALWRRVWLGLQSKAWIRNADDGIETAEVQPFLQLETAEGTTFKAEITTSVEDVVEPFDLSDDAFVPADRYVATQASLEFRSPRGWNVRPNLTVTAGQFFDGRRLQVNSSFNWAPSMHLEFDGGMEFNRIRFDQRAQAFDASLLRLTARLAANTKASLDIFGQYNSLSDQLTTNARFRYNFREGQDLWVVWNEGLNLERDLLGVPRLPFTDVRTLTVKYTHTMVF
jgi:hypothetical protein